MENLDTPQLKAILREHGLKPQKKFGQNFITNTRVLSQLVEAGGITKNDTVIEVGAGLGTLTKFLADAGERVIAIEKDTNLARILQNMFAHQSNIKIVNADIRDIKVGELVTGPYKMISNLPYYITSPILQMFLENETPPKVLVVLVQKEVAQEIIAQPGDLSILALSVQIFGTPEILSIVSRGEFYPAPNVDSAIIRITPFEKPLVPFEQQKNFFRLIKVAFQQRRKQIHNPLEKNLHIPKEKVFEILQKSKIDPVRRPQTLSVGEWLSLLQNISQEKSEF